MTNYSDAKITLQHVNVETGTQDQIGVLIFADGRLAAVLVRLDDEYDEGLRGHWHLEAGFGRCDESPAPFSSLRAGLTWIEGKLTTRFDLLDDALIDADRFLNLFPAGASANQTRL